MKQWRKGIAVCGMYLRKERKNPRFWMVILLTAIFCSIYMEGTVQFAKSVHLGVAPWSYVFFARTRIVRVIFQLLYLVIVCNLPFLEGNSSVVLMKSGRKGFCIGNVMYVVTQAFLYNLLILLLSVLLTVPNIEWTWKWGKVLGTLASGSVSEEFYTGLVFNSRMIVQETPFLMLILSFILSVFCYSFLGLVLLAANIIFTQRMGVFFYGLFVFFDFLVKTDVFVERFMYLSPVSWSNLGNLDLHENLTIHPSIQYAVIGYVVLLTGLVWLILRKSKKLYV